METCVTNKEAFVYCWIDWGRNMRYIGYHKGSQAGKYLCSSTILKVEIKKRPHEFTRLILGEGTAEVCYRVESSLLQEVDARNNPQYYNMHNNEAPFFHQGTQTPEHVEKRAAACRGRKLGPMRPEHKANLIAAFRSPETKAKRSLSNGGKNNPMYGKTPRPLSPESLERCRRAQLENRHALGYKYTQEQKEARSKLQRGSKRSLITCPHCQQIGGSNNMKRWHFDSCKKRKNGDLR